MIYVASVNGFPVMSLIGEFDIGNAGFVDAAFASLERAPVYIISFERTDFIDSSILATLLREHAKREESLVVLVPEMSKMHRLFTIADLMRYLPVATNRSEAIRQAEMLLARQTAPSLSGLPVERVREQSLNDSPRREQSFRRP